MFDLDKYCYRKGGPVIRWFSKYIRYKSHSVCLVVHQLSYPKIGVNATAKIRPSHASSPPTKTRCISKITGWWFGPFCYVYNILGIIIPIRLIFFRGVETTNQKNKLKFPEAESAQIPIRLRFLRAAFFAGTPCFSERIDVEPLRQQQLLQYPTQDFPAIPKTVL